MKKIIINSIFLFTCINSFAYNGLGNNINEQNIQKNNIRVLKSNINYVESGLLNYKIRQYNENSVIIKEFINDNGEVFAVSWSGITTPDFQEILGEYVNFSHNNNKVKDFKTAIYEQDDLIVYKKYSGRLKNGFAYLKSKKPNNFDIKNLSQ